MGSLQDDSIMRCLTCHYDLRSLCEARCPECGRAFDPADERTFIAGEVAGPAAGAARAARLYAVIFASCPLLAVALAYGTWAAARLTLGFWPQPYQPKAKHVGWVVDFMYLATMWGLMLSIPAVATGVIASLFAVAAALWARERPHRSLVVLLSCIAIGVGFIAFIRWDPHRVFDWLFD